MKIRPHHKVRRLGRVTLNTRMTYKGPALPLTGAGVQQLNLIPPEHDRLVRRVGMRRAKRIIKVLDVYHAAITIPEAIAYAWLEDHNYSFDFQSSVLGGLHIRGGAVLDFLIYDMSHEGLYAWRVQGDHWHGTERKQMRDRMQKDRVRGIWIGGAPIVEVVDLWENDLYDLWPEVLEYAAMGIEVRRV